MQDIFKSYEIKLERRGLIQNHTSLLGFLDADIGWNRKDPRQKVIEPIFNQMNINSIIMAQPAEPYRSIIDYYCRSAKDNILPQDCETRTFLHEIPILFEFDTLKILQILKHRKSVIVKDQGIIAYGGVSLEQAYVTFSSVCFACFVKYFVDFLKQARAGTLSSEQVHLFKKVAVKLDPLPGWDGRLADGPFTSESQVIQAMDQAGKLTVKYRLVDSFFGNISYLMDDILYISQTGSSLDELIGNIDPCPLNETSSVSITASSELPAHLEIVKQTGHRAILHGHPKFSVILSMDCQQEACSCEGRCHLDCPYPRSVCGVPIVPGEVGTGKYGLCHTVPAAIKGQDGVIVYGHGLFTTGKTDYNDAFTRLLNIENTCRQEFFKRVGILLEKSSSTGQDLQMETQ